MKGLVLHAITLSVAVALALVVWLRDEDAGVGTAASGDKVSVWSGNPESVERVVFEGPGRKVVMEARKDGTGRYFVVSVDKEEAARPLRSEADAGAPPPAPPPKRTKTRFVGVKAAVELADKLASLSAVRAVGKYDPKQSEDFGFDKPEGTLHVKLAGAEHSLVFGGTTPGGQERYAKHAASGQLYAVASDVLQQMLGAETRLLERDLHAFGDADVTRVRVSRGGKSREVVVVPGKKGAWADAATPDKVDETVGNWMTKVGRLKVMEYVETPSPPLAQESSVLRAEYFGGKTTLGFLELYKVPGEKGSEYLIRTEQGRWYVKVLATVGEQVDQDSASVVK